LASMYSSSGSRIGEPLDLRELTGEAGFDRKHRPNGGAGHVQPSLISFETKLSVSGRLSS
jgi:hypothetical protein